MSSWSGACSRDVTAVAHANIALSKYWGKRSGELNVPAVPSLSVTLAGLSTTTRVRIDQTLPNDVLVLDGALGNTAQSARVSRLLDLVWGTAERPRSEVVSSNDFPTAAGLASSASAFAALAVAANAIAGANRSASELSALARRVSGSAARSLFGGWVELPAGREDHSDPVAVALFSPEHWDLRVVVALTTRAAKSTGSTEAMVHTARTSPLYPAWLGSASDIHDRIRAAVAARDLASLGEAAEHSALSMHAVAMAACPGVLFWNGATVEVVAAVRRMRADGLAAYFTIDAGPHVKVITASEHAGEVERRLAAMPAVLGTIGARPGDGARLLDDAPPCGDRALRPSGEAP